MRQKYTPRYMLALVQFRTGRMTDGIKHTVAHTIVLCMHQQCFIPSVIGPVRNCTSAALYVQGTRWQAQSW